MPMKSGVLFIPEEKKEKQNGDRDCAEHRFLFSAVHHDIPFFGVDWPGALRGKERNEL